MKSEEKIKKISAQLRTEKKKMRSKRDGAIINFLSRYHDLNKLLEYLKSPKYLYEKMGADGKTLLGTTNQKPTQGEKYTVMLIPEKAD
jgi:hypothetical protein